MGRYTVDAVAMSRYLVDGLPSTADEAPTLTVAEAVWTATQKESIAGVTVGTTPNAVFRGLVTDGPLTVAPTDQQDLAVFGSLLDQHTLHDALLIANHRVRGTDAVVTNDAAFEGESTVWR
jgi:hypothetical protein